ncbi:MAG: FG-GAP repeat protein [Lewinellaceae bacterium]|nr:FG-GAP repeat protein [Lewinellaceae bacterium]
MKDLPVHSGNPADGFEQQTDAFFGYSVAISGDYAIVGAFGKDVSSKANQGTAYIFIRNGNSAWTQQAILTASDGDSGDEFGFSVGISGDYAIVGAPGKRIAGSKVREGKAYIFFRSGASWTQQAMLTAADGSAGDEVSCSVAIFGNYAILGASKKDVGGNADQGKAYIFVRSGTTWSQQAALTASDGAAQDFFGFSVAISGNYAMVGAYGKTVNGNTIQGKAYIFLRSGIFWSQQAMLTASNGATNDLFGNGVAISDDYAVVGAPGKDVAGGYLDVGAAYVFVRSGTTWSEQAILTASDGKAGRFGTGVAISGDYVCIGAENIGGNRAYVFGRSGMTWSQIAILAASNNVPSDKFGSGVGISGNHILVGDVLKDGLGANVGAVYFFAR